MCLVFPHTNEDKLSASAYAQRGVHTKMGTYAHGKGDEYIRYIQQA